MPMLLAAIAAMKMPAAFADDITILPLSLMPLLMAMLLRHYLRADFLMPPFTTL